MVVSKTEISQSKQLKVQRLDHKIGLDYILERISFNLKQGDSVSILGPSGCGKTTIMNYIAGIYEANYGSVAHNFLRLGCMFQEPRLLPWKTAAENLEFGLKAIGDSKMNRKRKILEMAHRLHLTERDLEKYPHQLSGGMQSRIALGRCLIIEPDLVLLDEPFSSLDIGLKTELYKELLDFLTDDASLLMITHDLMEAIRLSDRILLMDKDPGRICKTIQVTGKRCSRTEQEIYHSTAHLLADPDVRRIFNLPNQKDPEPVNPEYDKEAIL